MSENNPAMSQQSTPRNGYLYPRQCGVSNVAAATKLGNPGLEEGPAP